MNFMVYTNKSESFPVFRLIVFVKIYCKIYVFHLESDDFMNESEVCMQFNFRIISHELGSRLAPSRF